MDDTFQSGISNFLNRMERAVEYAEDQVALKVLELSQDEVPIYIGDDHTGGHLQNSGTVGRDGRGAYVGYNTPYAAYQHEGAWDDGSHVIRHHTATRAKTKYLEDPMKHNNRAFREHMGAVIKSRLS